MPCSDHLFLSFTRPYLKKPFRKVGLEWLKVKALSSSPVPQKKKERKKEKKVQLIVLDL
jgi:hypothetical protein